MHELKHHVNEECIAYGFPLKHDVEAPETRPSMVADASEVTYDPTQAQKWRICQNYGAPNKVTQVFPMPQGDI